jgi:ATP-dependent Clp protease adapter protein ClpS
MRVWVLTPGFTHKANSLPIRARGTPMSQQHSDRPQGAPGDPSSGPAQPQGSPRPHRLPPYKVILHHHATLDLMFIVRTVMELTRLCRAEATHKMWEAYHCGQSLLLVTHKERAELFVEQFAYKGLTVTIEPA